jgi:hypothetical protein
MNIYGSILLLYLIVSLRKKGYTHLRKLSKTILQLCPGNEQTQAWVPQSMSSLAHLETWQINYIV